MGVGRKEGEQMDIKKEGIAKEIAEKEGLTPKERKEELIRAGLDFTKDIPEGPWIIVIMVVWAILCFLPGIAQLSNLEPLSFLLSLYVIEIPLFVVFIAVGLLAALLPFGLSERLRVKKGGCHSDHHTVVLVKEGIYKVIRNPEYFFLCWLLILISIIISFGFRFTALSIIGDILVIMGFTMLARAEEKFNIQKWGDEYREYMKEVPRFNFIQGLWRLRKKG